MKDDHAQSSSLADKKIEDLELDSNDKRREANLYGRTVKKFDGIIDEKEKLLVEKDAEISDLVQEIVFVKGRAAEDIEDYQDEIKNMSSGYREQIAVLKRGFSSTKQDDAEQIKNNTTKIKSLQRKVKRQRSQITRLKDSILEKDLEINKTHDQLAFAQDKQQDLKKLFKSKPQVIEVEGAELLKSKDKYIAELKDKLVKAMKQIERIESQADSLDRSDEIKKLNRQMKSIRMQLSQRDSILQDKNEKFSLLKERLADAQERLGFVEEIVEEKDSQLGELKTQLIELRDQCIQ